MTDVTDAPLTAAASVIEHVDSEVKLIAYIIGCILIAFVFYMVKGDRDNKKLTEEKEKAEKERTEHRTKERDTQINGITSRIDGSIKEIWATLTNHLEEHKTMDNRIHDRLCKIESNVHSIDINIAKIMMKLEMSETERARHEHNA
jgi:uncharacterized protein YacL